MSMMSWGYSSVDSLQFATCLCQQFCQFAQGNKWLTSISSDSITFYSLQIDRHFENNFEERSRYLCKHFSQITAQEQQLSMPFTIKSASISLRIQLAKRGTVSLFYFLYLFSQFITHKDILTIFHCSLGPQKQFPKHESYMIIS